MKYLNRPFPSSPLNFKTSLRCEVFVMNVFIHIEIRANHHDKNFALRLTLKEIETEGNFGNGVHSASMLVRCSCIVRFLLLYIARHNVSLLDQGCSQGGSWGARDPLFGKLFLTKQTTTGGENAMTISWP